MTDESRESVCRFVCVCVSVHACPCVCVHTCLRLCVFQAAG